MKKRLLVGVMFVSMTMLMTGCCLNHEWQDATCTTPKTCSKCQEVEGEALGHIWDEATYETPKTCNVCKITEGDALSVKADEYYEKGRCYLYGLDGNDIDLELAYNNFNQAKEIGDTDANFYLGLLCDKYAHPERDYELAKSYYEACEDNSYAQIALGLLYYDGKGVVEDKAKAEELFQSAVDSGCVEGYWGKASIAYDAGEYETELECYNKVLEGTEQIYVGDAMSTIGILYEYGEGVEQSYTKAMEWYEKAVELGNANGMLCIGYMYEHGSGVEQNGAKAIEFYEKAAYLGNETAMNNMGYMYEHGNGVEQDYAKAMEWYKKAADAGDKSAMYNIGYMYEFGEGVEQSYSMAMEWYEKAVDAGDETAQDDVERVKSYL